MIRRVKKRYTAPLFRAATGTEKKIDLLWGDRVRVLSDTEDRWKVKARGLTGFVDPGHVGHVSYLELYFIDVGQGDGVLIRTPDDRHVLIDGGWPRRAQPTGKNAADFVDWKFFKDYEQKAIHLDAMICSHNDQDHYGGLWDLLDAAQEEELDVDEVFVEAFHHAGLAWWKGSGGRTLGPSRTTPDGRMWTRLLGDRASLVEGLDPPGSGPELQGEWSTFLRKVKLARTAGGDPTPVSRLSHLTGSLPGFADAGGVDVKVLGPVELDVDGSPAIRRFSGGTDKNTNGNSVLLRVDYDRVRILLTGDLNKVSQQALLGDYAGAHGEFECDVAKACHHGAEDASVEFLRAVHATCTIISSGDSEGHDHPRPAVVAASGLTGFQTIRKDQLVTPLVLSTELARSIGLGKVDRLQERDADGNVLREVTGEEMERFRTHYKMTMAGARGPKSGTVAVGKRRLAARTTYGLINVRTDGKTVMVAALNEKEFRWNVFTFKGRFGGS